MRKFLRNKRYQPFGRFKTLSITKVRSTVIFVANAIKNHFEVRSTVTFATNVAVLRTLNGFFIAFSTKITVLRTLKKRWVMDRVSNLPNGICIAASLIP
jgi:hypothetical protein